MQFRRDVGGFSGARMKARVYALGASFENARHAQDSRLCGMRKQQAHSGAVGIIETAIALDVLMLD